MKKKPLNTDNWLIKWQVDGMFWHHDIKTDPFSQDESALNFWTTFRSFTTLSSFWDVWRSEHQIRQHGKVGFLMLSYWCWCWCWWCWILIKSIPTNNLVHRTLVFTCFLASTDTYILLYLCWRLLQPKCVISVIVFDQMRLVLSLQQVFDINIVFRSSVDAITSGAKVVTLFLHQKRCSKIS